MTFESIGVEVREGARIADIRIEVGSATGVSDGAEVEEPIEAYLVEPSAATPSAAPGLLFAHWYDPRAPNGNRTEFLDEAIAWATERRATAILPQLIFPWRADPDGSTADVGRIRTEVERLRRCLDLLVVRPGVDAARIGVIGHDFGAMHAALLGTTDGRPVAYVLIAAVPRWGDWFLPFWEIVEDRIEYLRAVRPVDPIEHIRKIAPARLLFQFADRDFYIAPMAGFEFSRAAGAEAKVNSYDAEHDMASQAALADRTAFLEDGFRIEPGRGR